MIRAGRLGFCHHGLMPAPTIRVTCPCCQAKLDVHVETATVVAQEEAPRKPAIEDLAVAAAHLKGEAAKREDLFQKSFQNHKQKSASADSLFDELLKKAKEKGDEPPPKRALDWD